MAIEVRIPTILRTYTGGEKAVEASGATLTDLIENLEANHPGLGERLLENGELRRFINVYVNDEDVRFEGGLAKELSDGDVVVILPAVAGGSRLGSTNDIGRRSSSAGRAASPAGRA